MLRPGCRNQLELRNRGHWLELRNWPRGAHRVFVLPAAGFASTIAWPLSHYLIEAVGWRAVCEVYALALLLCAPIYAVLLSGRARTESRAAIPETPSSMSSTPARARVLSWAFAGAALLTVSTPGSPERETMRSLGNPTIACYAVGRGARRSRRDR
jgi:hypothetical protein